jgi:hypothetical protein
VSNIEWEPQPARHDYAAAAEFLTLTMPHETATRLADQLADGPLQHLYAKDILRQASAGGTAGRVRGQIDCGVS